jgi:large subunit ribosomal protein L30
MKKIKVTKIKSDINRPGIQKKTLEALGLRKINSTNVFEANPAVLGMIAKVRHLVNVEELEQDVQKKKVVKKVAPKVVVAKEKEASSEKKPAAKKTVKASPKAAPKKAAPKKAAAKKVDKPKKEATE